MALKLTLTNPAALLPGSPVPVITFYVKLGGLNFNAFTGSASSPLTYRYFDATTLAPTGDWLTLPLPAEVAILLPRQLMMSITESPFGICYDAAAALLRGVCGTGGVVENLL